MSEAALSQFPESRSFSELHVVGNSNTLSSIGREYIAAMFGIEDKAADWLAHAEPTVFIALIDTILTRFSPKEQEPTQPREKARLMEFLEGGKSDEQIKTYLHRVFGVHMYTSDIKIEREDIALIVAHALQNPDARAYADEVMATIKSDYDTMIAQANNVDGVEFVSQTEIEALAPEQRTTAAEKLLAHGRRSMPTRSNSGAQRHDTSMPDAEGAYLASLRNGELLSAEEEVELAQRIEAGLYARRLLDGQESPQTDGIRDALIHEPELLEEIAQQGKAAYERFFTSNLRLVASLAKPHIGHTQHMAFGDLMSEGNFGLMRAIKKFDYTKGFKFSTYATLWIKQSLSRAMVMQDSTVRIPVHMKEQYNMAERVYGKMTNELGREPTDDEFNEELGFDAAGLRQKVRKIIHPLYLDQPIETDGDTSIGDLIAASAESGSAEASMIDRVLLSAVVNLIKDVLSEREYDVFMRHNGALTGKVETLADIGKSWNITGERVRQIYRIASNKIKASEDIQRYRTSTDNSE